jgi:hypothetical protein
MLHAYRHTGCVLCAFEQGLAPRSCEHCVGTPPETPTDNAVSKCTIAEKWAEALDYRGQRALPEIKGTDGPLRESFLCI